MNRPRHSTLGSVETLESRIAMAANVTASLNSAGLLTVEGTAQRDEVQIYQSAAGIVVSSRGSSVGSPFRADAVRSIKVSLLDGNDALTVALNAKKLDSIVVNLGNGEGEQVNLGCGEVGGVNIDAVASKNTGVKFTGTATGIVFADYGSEVSKNTFRLASSSAIDTLELKMGNGDDLLALDARSRIKTARVAMGGGNDTLAVQTSVVIDGGTIDGGAGTNRFTGQRGWLTGGVKLVSIR